MAAPLRKFFFDDVRKKPGPEWVLAVDVPSAIATLSKQSFDVMSLDHDIGFEMSCADCYELYKGKVESYEELERKLIDTCTHHLTGTHLARWMVENLKEWPKLIIIHSANPYGARRMESLLARHTKVLVIWHDLCKYETIESEVS